MIASVGSKSFNRVVNRFGSWSSRRNNRVSRLARVMKADLHVKIKRFSLEPFLKGSRVSKGQRPLVATAVAKPQKRARAQACSFKCVSKTQEGERKSVRWTVFAWGDPRRGSPRFSSADEKILRCAALVRAANQKGTPSLAGRPLFQNSSPSCFSIHPLRSALRMVFRDCGRDQRLLASGHSQALCKGLDPKLYIFSQNHPFSLESVRSCSSPSTSAAQFRESSRRSAQRSQGRTRPL